jgi:hypothetical protein
MWRKTRPGERPRRGDKRIAPAPLTGLVARRRRGQPGDFMAQAAKRRQLEKLRVSGQSLGGEGESANLIYNVCEINKLNLI